MTLQKLVHLHTSASDSESDSDSESSSIEGIQPKQKRGPVRKALHKMFKSRKRSASTTSEVDVVKVQEKSTLPNGIVRAHTFGSDGAPVKKLRTLQRYHGGPNQERTEYMESRSPLQTKGLAVSAEQVSLYLTSGNSLPFKNSSQADETKITALYASSKPQLKTLKPQFCTVSRRQTLFSDVVAMQVC